MNSRSEKVGGLRGREQKKSEPKSVSKKKKNYRRERQIHEQDELIFTVIRRERNPEEEKREQNPRKPLILKTLSGASTRTFGR